jgi:UDP-N-acetyl-D-mannosaminuronate dehydrogenase
MKKRNISIIGLGYVGLPLLFSFSAKKFKVIGIDYTFLQKNCKLVVDTRGRFTSKHKNVIQL